MCSGSLSLMQRKYMKSRSRGMTAKCRYSSSLTIAWAKCRLGQCVCP